MFILTKTEYFNSEKPLNRNISVETPTSKNYQGVKCPGAIVRGLKYTISRLHSLVKLRQESKLKK